MSRTPKDYKSISKQSNDQIVALIICVIYALWLGARPTNTHLFGDTHVYAAEFDYMQQIGRMPEIDPGEWVWQFIMYFCTKWTDASGFFTIIDLGYFGFTFWACRRLTPNNLVVTLLFTMGALSFYSYGTNGIRNGLACSIVIVSLTYIQGNKISKLFSILLAVIAYFIHHSTLLPIIVSWSAVLFVRSFKWAYSFWLISIVLSLIAGNFFNELFATLGFDDHRVSYMTTEAREETFTHIGFRWDFLLYSMMPIVLGYYVVVRRGLKEKTFQLLLNTYTLSNAFWILVIRSNFSNRFAYLSWFLYPIILAYPLLKLNVWGERQGQWLRYIMLANIAFTWFMSTFYWAS